MKSILCGHKGFLINMESGDEMASQMKVLSQPKWFFVRMHLQEYSLKRLKISCENSKNYKIINTHINIYVSTYVHLY